MVLDQIYQAFTLFGLGMGTVFVLLSLLISCVSILSYVCQKYEKNPVHNVPNIGMNASVKRSVSEQEKAIVTKAIQAHRQAKGL